MDFHAKKKLLPLKKQLFLIISFFFVCITIITIITCSFYIHIHASLLKKDMDYYVSQFSVSVEEMYRTCRSIAYSLSYNQLIQNYLLQENSSDKYSDYKLAYNQITNLMDLSPYIRDIAVINWSGSSAMVNGDYETYESLYREASNNSRSLSSCGLASIDSAECQILSMPVYALDDTALPQIGSLFLAVDVNSFLTENPISNVDYITDYVLTDDSQHLIYGNQQYCDSILESSGESTLQIDSVSYLVKQYSMPVINNTFYILINQDAVTHSGREIAVIHFICMAVLLLIITGSIFGLYRPLIHSLQTLTRYMKTVTSDGLSNYKEGIQIEQGILGSTEIHDISRAFNRMLRHIYQLNHTIFENHTHMYEMELNNKKTEIAFLRSQINPHFLYNTLTMICGMASVGMKQEIIDTAGSLSQIFRYAIKGNEMVTLREELELAKSYIQIQLYRFEDRFTVSYDIADEVLSCLIPKMILQPVIENAIVHGLEPNPTQGTLQIGARRNPEKGYLVLWVYDTGLGMPSEKKEQLQNSLKNLRRTEHSTIMDSYKDMDSVHHDSIGLFNVNNRIQLYFGTEYSLTLDSEEGIGTNIQFRIPYQTEDSKQKKGE